MMTWPVLSVLIFQPLIGALFIFLVRGKQELISSNVKAVALWSTGITFLLACFLWIQFDPTVADFQFLEERTWIPSLGISYSLGIDGISIIYIVLTSFELYLHFIQLGSNNRACAGVYGFISIIGNHDFRCFLCTRHRFILSFF